MNVLQLSFFASVLILIIIVIRALAINKLPKKTFLAFWAVALLRLLIPFSFPAPFSVYSVIGNSTTLTKAMTGTPAANISSIATLMQMPSGGITTAPGFTSTAIPPIWMIIWIAGVILCALYFVTAYIKCYREFKTSSVVHNDFVAAWLDEHKIVRPISIKQSSRILSPLTYGVFRPVILIPQNIDWSNEQQLQYIFAHEYTHIRRFDAITKLFLIAALCIHWFNPLVWAMYILSNRDIELSCDEIVVRLFGETLKSSYALTLISMEEKKSRLTPLYNNFSKYAIEERIVSIMKYKKTTIAGIFVAFALVIGVSAIFASNRQDNTLSEHYLGDKLTSYIDKAQGLIIHTPTGLEMPLYYTVNSHVWIEAIYDENISQGKDNSIGVSYSIYRDYMAPDNLGEASIGIVTLRDPQTNEIIGITEMDTKEVIAMIEKLNNNSDNA